MTGTNGLRYTNPISMTIGGLDDLRLVVFTNEWPSQVRPWPVLPTNYADFVNLSNVMAVWYRQNTGKMNVSSNFWTQGLQARVANQVPGIPFHDPGATGGDSGSPVSFVLNRRPVLPFQSTPTSSRARSSATPFALIGSAPTLRLTSWRRLMFQDFPEYDKSAEARITYGV